MIKTLKVLSALLTYPTTEMQEAIGEMRDLVCKEGLLTGQLRRALNPLIEEIGRGELYDLQERYVLLFDRTRTLSLHLFEHVHGESRDRGQAMVALLELYRSNGLDLCANELPDFLPVFLEFLSTLPDTQAASLLGEAAHVLGALGERLHKRESAYRAVFGALGALAADPADAEALAAMMQEPDDDPGDLETMDGLWAETAVTFGPSDVGCPKAENLIAAMNANPAPAPRRAARA